MLNHKIRYIPVLRILRENPNFTVCEIGAGSKGVGEFMKDRAFVGVDRDFSDYSQQEQSKVANMRFVKADAKKLPFENKSFDIVFSLDMIEHILPSDRSQVVKEMLRISRGLVVIGFPCGGRSLEVDRKQGKIISAFSLKMPGWLLEHLSIPYPEEYEMDNILKGLGQHFIVQGSENILVHKIVQLLEFLTGGFRYLDKLFPARFLKLFSDKGKNFYRKVYVITQS